MSDYQYVMFARPSCTCILSTCCCALQRCCNLCNCLLFLICLKDPWSIAGTVRVQLVLEKRCRSGLRVDDILLLHCSTVGCTSVYGFVVRPQSCCWECVVNGDKLYCKLLSKHCSTLWCCSIRHTSADFCCHCCTSPLTLCTLLLLGVTVSDCRSDVAWLRCNSCLRSSSACLCTHNTCNNSIHQINTVVSKAQNAK